MEGNEVCVCVGGASAERMKKWREEMRQVRDGEDLIKTFIDRDFQKGIVGRGGNKKKIIRHFT